MHLTDLSQIAGTYQHVYLSPHLDDAVLSCGGAIVNQRRADERVLVVTLCTAAPPAQGPFSELAQEFHRFWALSPEQVVAARRREDTVAMELVSADFVWADFLDAIYRRPEAYTTRESLFGTPDPDDPLLPELAAFLRELQDRIPSAAIYAPLGVGFHVDHQITRTAAQHVVGGSLLCYEDSPYATYPGALDARLTTLGEQVTPRIVPINGALDQKLSGIEAYASQLGELFRTTPMREVLTNYAMDVGSGQPAERLWHSV